jgi:Cdc6-like AAA superfamily ATPase
MPDTTKTSEISEVFRIGRAFSPSAPITDRTLFAGRKDQMNRLIGVVSQRGQHGLIYGERGVGKTSLARVMQDVLGGGSTFLTPYYTCNSNDNFTSIWRGLLSDIRISVDRKTAGFTGATTSESFSLANLVSDAFGPDNVRRALELIGKPAAIFIDEFDRPTDDATRALFADTVKILSDTGTDVTITFVGVGDTIEDLIKEHQSVARSLVQISMPRMAAEEIAEIIHSGMKTLNFVVESAFVNGVRELSLGLPHYAHLLGQHGAYVAAGAGRKRVKGDDLAPAINGALEDVSQTVRRKYHDATFSNRDTIYKEVLLACALSQKDEMGTFGSPEVRDKLRQITGHPYDIPAFANHLNEFSSTGPRGGVLQKRGTTRRFRYRFVDPLMPPYVLMRGHADKFL